MFSGLMLMCYWQPRTRLFFWAAVYTKYLMPFQSQFSKHGSFSVHLMHSSFCGTLRVNTCSEKWRLTAARSSAVHGIRMPDLPSPLFHCSTLKYQTVSGKQMLKGYIYSSRRCSTVMAVTLSFSHKDLTFGSSSAFMLRLLLFWYNSLIFNFIELSFRVASLFSSLSRFFHDIDIMICEYPLYYRVF